MSRIVCIPPSGTTPPFPEEDVIEVEFEIGEHCYEHAKEFIGDHFTTFWGTWEGKRVLMLCDDMGMHKNLAPNKRATLAYLDQCIPGTMHVILGPAVALMDEELW